MRDGCARLRARRGVVALWLVVDSYFFFAQTAASRVVAGVHQDAKGPGDETGLTAKTCDAALHLQKRLLHRVFRVGNAAQYVTRKVFHPRAMERIQPLIGAEVASPACLG